MAKDFQAELRKQLRFLHASCDAYDNGNKEEAVRLATTLAILFYNSGKSQSLLSHLKLGDVRLMSTSALSIKSTGGNLTTISIDPVGPCEFKPAFDAHPANFVPVKRWWEKEQVFLMPKATRCDLVLWARNKDGGAHVDTDLDKRYEELVNGAGWKLSEHKPDGTLVREVKFENAHFAALRQIAYEVLKSPALALD
jgi:hypothetical protein